MKKSIELTLVMILITFCSAGVLAQDTMYVHKKDASVLKVALSDIDSLIYYAIEETPIQTGTVADANGKEYKTVVIGGQEWMAENLAYLPSGKSFSDKATGSEDAAFTKHYYVYGFDSGGDMTALNADATALTTYEELGVMYNWYAAIGISENVVNADSLDTYLSANTIIQGVCPAGWHLPTNQEYNDLLSAIGKDADTGGDPLKATTGWDTNTGTDDYGFALLPSGRRKSDSTKDFENSPAYGYLWTATFEKYETGSTETGTARAYARYIKGADDYFKENKYRSSYGHAVRCVKD